MAGKGKIWPFDYLLAGINGPKKLVVLTTHENEELNEALYLANYESLRRLALKKDMELVKLTCSLQNKKEMRDFYDQLFSECSEYIDQLLSKPTTSNQTKLKSRCITF